MKSIPPIVCRTPLGEELAEDSWLEESTKIMSPDELQQLLQRDREIAEKDLVRRLLHTHPTVKLCAIKLVKQCATGIVVEPADTSLSKSEAARHEGSSPSDPTLDETLSKS